jgi:transposase-like protein
MAFIIKITGVTQKEQLNQLVRFLSLLPGFSQGRAIQTLKHLPFELPQLKTSQDAKKMKERLEALGVSVSLRVVNDQDEQDTTVDEPPAPPRPENKSPIEPLITPTKRTNPAEFVPLERNVRPLVFSTPKKRVRKKASPWAWVALVGLVGVIAYSAWNSQQITPTNATTAKTVTPAATNKATQRQQAQREQNRQSAAKLHQAIANEQDPVRKEKLLQQAIQQNPYQTESWNQLIHNLEQQGKHIEAHEVRKQMAEQHDKPRQVIESIAKAFGVENPTIHLSREEMQLNMNGFGQPAEKFYQRGYQIFKKMREEHPDKEIVIQSGNLVLNRWELRVAPHQEFPSQQWIQDPVETAP